MSLHFVFRVTVVINAVDDFIVDQYFLGPLSANLIELFKHVLRAWRRFKHRLLLLKLMNKLFSHTLHGSLEIVCWNLLLRHTPKAFLTWVEVYVKHVAEIGFPEEGYVTQKLHLLFRRSFRQPYVSPDISPPGVRTRTSVPLSNRTTTSPAL